MPRKKFSRNGHTGRTASGNTRDLKIERIGKITIYKRGDTYYLYYRQGGITQRRKVDGNLAIARATAHKVGDALAENRPSPIAYDGAWVRAVARYSSAIRAWTTTSKLLRPTLSPLEQAVKFVPNEKARTVGLRPAVDPAAGVPILN